MLLRLSDLYYNFTRSHQCFQTSYTKGKCVREGIFFAHRFPSLFVDKKVEFRHLVINYVSDVKKEAYFFHISTFFIDKISQGRKFVRGLAAAIYLYHNGFSQYCSSLSKSKILMYLEKSINVSTVYIKIAVYRFSCYRKL